jgi:hypothetical protein
MGGELGWQNNLEIAQKQENNGFALFLKFPLAPCSRHSYHCPGESD